MAHALVIIDCSAPLRSCGVPLSMPPKKSQEQTSAQVASKAGKMLSDAKSSKDEKSVAGSALTQAPNKTKKK